MRRLAWPLAAVLLLATSLQLAEVGPAAARTSACPLGSMPYQGIAGASLKPEFLLSKDVPAVQYLRWRGTVPSFDGMPLSVDVTIPCGSSRPLPTVTMAHGFTDDKTVWEETGKSDIVDSKDRPGSNDHWNNIWFASHGYAVLNYTARGWRDSCGSDTPARTATAPAPACAPYQYWIHLDDKRWEVRDLQWLTGGLVQSGIADAHRLAVTGGSYGGTPTAMAALLAGKVVCGAVPQRKALGPDPCAGKANGQLVPWMTPDGTTPLDWAAALPLYTYGDLLEVLAPNGRGTDGWSTAPADGSHTDPFGVPLSSTVSGLLLAAKAYGSLAPPGSDPSSDVVTSTNRLLAGNPFAQSDPQVIQGIREYRQFKSPITITPQGHVPIFWVEGLTDALFPGMQALQMLNHVRATDPRYPMKLFLGDIGHDYAAERQDEWDLVKRQMNAFLDHYLRPDRTTAKPTFDVGATVTRCLDHDAPLRYTSASTWAALHPHSAPFTSTKRGTTSTTKRGPAAVATDPISTATLGGPKSYKGCRIMRPSRPDPTAVTYEFPLKADLVMMGGPVVDVRFRATGNDVPLSVRLWDVAADGSEQGLVSRGTYRVDGGRGRALDARFQISDQGYRFPAGHRLKVEVSADDSPYYEASNLPARVSVTGLKLTVPLLRGTNSPVHRATPDRHHQRSRSVWVVAGVVLLVLAIALRFWRRTRPGDDEAPPPGADPLEPSS